MRGLKLSLFATIVGVLSLLVVGSASATACGGSGQECSCEQICHLEKLNCLQNAGEDAEPIALCIQQYEPCIDDCPVCANGEVEVGEDCDPGADVPGDCCDSMCHAVTNGTSCFVDEAYCIVGTCYAANCGTQDTLTNSTTTIAPCDDLNECTTDACTIEMGCTHTPVEGCGICGNGMVDGEEQCDVGESIDPCCVDCAYTTNSCSDGSLCTTGDICSNGSCTPGTATVCTASDQCHDVGTCDGETGACSNPAKPNNTTCSDSDLCTSGESCQDGTCGGGTPVVCTALDQCHDVGTCNPETGACTNPNKADTTPCDDGSACTLPDQCIGGVCTGQGFSPSGVACNDNLACTVTDVCDGSGVCVGSGNPCLPGTECNTQCNETNPGYNCFSSAATTCADDGKVCTSDVCDGAGACSHPAVPIEQCPKGYAILGWPPAADVDGRFGRVGRAGGRVCTDFIRLARDGTIEGDAVASRSVGVALSFGDRTNADEDAVTGGGTIQFPRHPEEVTIGGVQDITGTRVELTDCSLAATRAETRRAGIDGLTATATMGAITVPVVGTQTINMVAGQNVIDITGNVLVKPRGKLILNGAAGTTDVILRVNGELRVRRDGAVELTGGLTPEQVIWVVDGSVFLRRRAYLRGTAFSDDTVFMGWSSQLDGQALGSDDIQVRSEADVNLHPWQGW